METTNATTALPMRLAFTDDAATMVLPALGKAPGMAIAGSRGSWGDAGWTVIACKGEQGAQGLMARYPQAAMPCWARFTKEVA